MLRMIRELTLSVLLALSLFLGVDSVFGRNYIDGPSMEPNLHGGQLLLVSRLGISGYTQRAYAAAHLEGLSSGHGWVPPRGSIGVFVHPLRPEALLVKRVIGLPGEEIAIRSGVVYIDGQPLDEPYVVFPDKRNLTPRRVPPDSVFMLGDNRPNSGDSRHFGPVPRANLLGVAVLRYWPLDEFGVLLGGAP